MGKIIFILVFLFFFINHLKAQVIEDKQQTKNANQFENYSKTDWERQGIFRNFKPENEITELRTRTSKHFLNPDSTVTAILMAGSSINYEENGTWHTITREIEQNNSERYSHYPYSNTHNAFKSYYPATTGTEGILTILKEGTINEWINPQMYYIVNGEKVNYQKTNIPDLQVNENEIIYRNVFDNIDVKFIQNNDGRKMDIILNDSNAIFGAPEDATYLVFEETVKLPEKWVTKEENGGINVYDENNLWIGQYSKPVYFDSNIEKNDQSHRISGNYNFAEEGENLNISILIPLQWLKAKNRQYPSIIDPTISIYPGNTNYYTGTGTYNGSNGQFSKQNDSLYNIRFSILENVGFMKFDLLPLFHASSISAATINLYCYSASISIVTSNYLRRLINDPVITPASSMGSGSTIISTGQWTCSTCWYSYVLSSNEFSNIYSRINLPGWSAYSVSIYGSGSSDWYNFYGYSNTTYKPYMTVTYCTTPGMPINLTSTLTGTTTANLLWSAGTPSGSPTVRYYWEVFTTGGVYITGNNTTSTYTAVSGLSCGSGYYYTVQAYTTCDNTWSPLVTSNQFLTDVCNMFVPNTGSNTYTECSGHLYDYYGSTSNYGDNWDGFSVIYPGDVTKAVQLTGSFSTQSGSDFIYIYDGVGTNGTLLGTYSGMGNILTTTSSGANVPLTVRFVSDGSINYQGFDFKDTCVYICSNPAISPALLITDRTNFCSDDSGSIILSSSGGSGSTLLWYSSSCNSGIIGTGNPLVIASPTVSTTYYSNWYSAGCIPSTCKSVDVFVNPAPVPPLLAQTDTNNYCTNYTGNITLGVSGGSGSSVEWFYNSCGGTFIGTGISILLPATFISTTYYARWNVYSCTSSACVSIEITVLPLPVAAQSGASNMNNFCANIGGNISLGLSGGSGDYASWYRVSCGGTTLGTGNPISIPVPVTTTKYFGRWENSCGQSTCITFTVTVLSLATAPASLSSDRNNLCSDAGGNILISSSGGSGTTHYWYLGSCGNNLINSGRNITITAPTNTTVYYARWQNTCGNSVCKTVGITINPLPVSPVLVASDTNNLCPGSGATIILSVSGGTGLTTAWYVLGCGSIPIGNGTPYTTSAPSVTTTYWANMQSQGCVNSNCVSVTIEIQSPAVINGNISGMMNTCEGNSAIYSVTFSAGQTYNWSAPNDWTGTGTTNSINFITGSTSGNVTVIPSNICGSGTGLSIYVSIGLPADPVSIFAYPDTIFQGQSSTLNVTGILSAGETWVWYENNCGSGILIGTGITLTISSTTALNYYVRVENGICVSNCKSITVTLLPVLNAPGIINVSNDSVCYGSSSVLNVANGLNGGQWYWHLNSCGGIVFGTGSPITVTPSTATIYYVRQQLGSFSSGCASKVINVNTLSSLSSGSIAATLTTICTGDSTTLNITGGSLGTLADWQWYSGSCGAFQEGNGSTIKVFPSSTTTYYIRGVGKCNTTICDSYTIQVFPLPHSPLSVTSNMNGFCSDAGGFLNLSISGGNGDVLEWWTGGCGYTTVGSGENIAILSPIITTIYYANWQTISCGTSACASIEISVIQKPNDPISSIASPDTIGKGQSTNLTVLGNLSTGETWLWFENSCGTGTIVGTGSTLEVYPVSTTTYYVRAENGLCHSDCHSAMLIIPGSLNDAGVITTSPSATICSGNSTTMGITNSLNGGNWYWYQNVCGGNLLGTGLTINVIPSATTIYSVRQELGGLFSNCVTQVVNVNSFSSVPDSAFTLVDTICEGQTTTLTITGGSLGTSANWNWYSGSCGGQSEGNGLTLNVNPTISTDYYVRAEGICNTTGCVNLMVTVSDSSETATSTIASNTTICKGQTTTLSITGGSLGTSADWYWYSGSCGGIFEGNGLTLAISPTISTDYYVRAEGICNTTACVNLMVTVNDSSETAASITASNTTICEGQTTTLSITGGSLGTSADWYWYSGSCGGIFEGNGLTLAISPTISTDYYTRAEGTCNTSACVNLMVTVNYSSETATSITASNTTICEGQTTTLSITGGSLGTSAAWHWYSGSCGGQSEGNGLILTVSPAISTDYYARAAGICNTTNCVEISITVNDSSETASSISSGNSIICLGQSTILTIIGGSLGTSADWYWYSGSCGSLPEGIGINLIISPTISADYYARAEGTCNTTICLSSTIIVNYLSEISGLILSSTDTICSGSSATLSKSGGITGTGVSWTWYSGTCGGAYAGVGDSIFVSPSTTTHFYLRAEGICNTTLCDSVSVTVIDYPAQPLPISGNINPHPGNTEQYYVLDNSNAVSYTWTAPSGWTGNSNTNSVEYVVGSGQGSISVIPVNFCGSGPARTLTVTTGYSISGYYTYDNSSGTPLDSVIVLLSQNGVQIDTVQADINGFYHFSNIQSGIYTIDATTHKLWGSVNATDAVKVKRHFAGTELLTSSVRLHAADVNLSNSINTTDAVKITRRFVGSDTSFVRGDWNFEKPLGGDTIDVSANLNDTVIVNGSNIQQDFKGICIGDVNGSNLPSTGAKSSSKLSVDYQDLLRLNSNESFELPIIASGELRVGAISMILKFPKELLQIFDVQFALNNEGMKNEGMKNEGMDEWSVNNLVYNINGDELRVGWYANVGAINVMPNSPIIIINGKTTGNFKQGDVIKLIVANNSLCEFADEYGNSIENVVLKTYTIAHSEGKSNQFIESTISNDLFLFPNPAENIVNLRYRVANDGYVRISVYDVLGEKVVDVVNNHVLKGVYNSELNLSLVPSGVYTIKMILENKSFIVKRLVVTKH